MPINTAQSDFVQQYAAKRAAQIEKAKAIRESREAQQRQFPQQQQPQQQQSYQGAPIVPPTLQPQHASRTSNPMYHEYGQTGMEAFTPSVPPAGQRPSSQIVSTHTSSSSPPMALGSNVTDVFVNEEDFRRAVAMGVISSDQARQLWAMVAAHPQQQQQQQHHQQSRKPQDIQQSSYEAGTPVVYAAATYASNTRASQQPDMAGSRPTGQARRKPEWSNDIASDPSPTTSYAMQERGAPRSATREQLPEASFKPHVFDDNYRQGAGVAPSAPRSHKPEWNAEFVADSSGAFGAPPPVAKSTASRQQQRTGGGGAPSSHQRSTVSPSNEAAANFNEAPVYERTRHAQRQPQQQQPAQHPRDVVIQSRSVPQQQNPMPISSSSRPPRGGAQRAAAEPPPPLPPQDDNEVEFFLRQKQTAAEQFERALNEASTNEPCFPCSICGRSFREGIIQRHENACRIAQRKRKVFHQVHAPDEAIQIQKAAEAANRRQEARRTGSSAGLRGGAATNPAQKIPKWKMQHEQFQAAMRAMRSDNDPRASGGGMMVAGGRGMPPAPMDLDDRVPCPHCGRKFNSDVAERHIPKCKTTRAKPTTLLRRR